MLLNLALLTHRKTLAPISVLPPEVLARIFHPSRSRSQLTELLNFSVHARVPPLAPGRWMTRRCGRRSRATRRAPHHTDRMDLRDGSCARGTRRWPFARDAECRDAGMFPAHFAHTREFRLRSLVTRHFDENVRKICNINLEAPALRAWPRGRIPHHLSRDAVMSWKIDEVPTTDDFKSVDRSPDQLSDVGDSQFCLPTHNITQPSHVQAIHLPHLSYLSLGALFFWGLLSRTSGYKTPRSTSCTSLTTHSLYAGITLAADLQHAFATTVDATLRAKLPNALRRFETIVNQPNLTSIFGSTAFAEKALQYSHTPKEKKEKEPAAPSQPKAEKKPEKEEVGDDDDDKPYEEAPKEKTPLDLLPKSTLKLGDWKPLTRTATYFGVDFKYNEELTQTFMSSNQIGGFFNRLEASRKYWFGSVGVLGTTNNSIITGALIPRGQQEIRWVVEVAPDREDCAYELIDRTTRSKGRSSRPRLHGTLKLSWGQEVGRREEFQVNVLV
ncbi:hypothetical protein BC826DRAFT_1103563 [Russula brevipes]|nr:hypothetical protein BC826DRAFT_1103563 [Russula brevipes]